MRYENFDETSRPFAPLFKLLFTSMHYRQDWKPYKPKTNFDSLENATFATHFILYKNMV